MKTHQWVNVRYKQYLVRSIEADTYEEAVTKLKAMNPNDRLGVGPISHSWEYTPFKAEDSGPTPKTLTAEVIISFFKAFTELNKIKKGSKKEYEAQYWFLAGIRSSSPQQQLPPIIEILHSSGRSILK